MVSGSAEQTAEISLSLSPMTSMNHIHKSADKWVVSFLVSVFSKTLHFHIDRFRRHGNFFPLSNPSPFAQFNYMRTIVDCRGS